MPEKNILQDVIPPAQKRSIRDIPVPVRKRNGVRKPVNSTQRNQNDATEAPQKKFTGNINELNGTNYAKRRTTKKYFILGGVVAFLILLFVVLSNFDSATITIQPKQVDAVVTKTIPIFNLSTADTTTEAGVTTGLGYRVIELAKEATKVVPADSEEFIQTKARGTITVYNEYTEKNQTLIKNTRFESPQGLIYTIQNSVTIPGYTTVNGKKVPGTLDVEVVASGAGESYNTSAATFTIPGFKGQAQYDSFYAKTKTAIAGGFDGVKKIVSEENITQASAELRQTIIEQLKTELANQVSKEFVTVFDQTSFTFGSIVEEQQSDSADVTLKLSGSVAAKVFNTIDLSNAIASESVLGYEIGEQVLIKDIAQLPLSIDGDKIVVDQNMTFVWQNNQEDLKRALIGKKKSEFGSVINTFPGITKANVVVKPFWQTRFPENIKDIRVIIGEQA